MKLTELLTGPWAILPDSLREIQQIYATHLKGDKIDIKSVEARLGRPLANEQQRYTVREGGVAVLPVEGVIAPKANLFTEISGGVSAQMLIQQVQSAGADSRVKGLVQVIDSPGGSVFGIPEWAQAVAEVAKVKPVVTVSDATIASAAMWGGSAANAVYLTGPTVHAGSIGVYARMGLSQPDPTSMEFVRGKYKRGAINGQAPSAEYMAYFEGQLDHLYSVFVDTMAAHRGTTSEKVLELMADGRVFIGQQAIDVGLVDGFASVNDIVERMATDPAQFSTRRKAVFALGGLSAESAGEPKSDTTPPGAGVAQATEPPKSQGTTMPTTREQLAAEAPELLTAILAEGHAAGATAERQRIQAVEGQLMPGHEALIATLKFDGKSTAGDAAMAVTAAERTVRETHAKNLASEAPAPLKQVPAATVAKPLASSEDDKSIPVDERAKAAWDKDAKLRAEFSSLAAYTAFVRADESGQARILSRA